MIKVFIIISVIILLLIVALYLLYSDYNIEKFTNLDPVDQEDINAREEERKQQDIDAAKLQEEAIQKINTINNENIDPLATIQPIQPIQPQSQIEQPTITQPPNNNIVEFLSVISAYEPWGVYYAGNFSGNKLNDLLGRNNRNAVATGTINTTTSTGNGANGSIKSISGTSSSFIEWPANSIPEKFTICSITRYTGTENNKRILTARNATSTDDWIHGHKGGKRGVVYYTDYKTNSSPDFNLTGNITDWVVTCAKNDTITPTNIYINGAPSGIKGGGQGKLRLAINKLDDNSIINQQSDFALSYIIIWDTILTDTALKIVSSALMNYLNTGEDLLFDTNSLSTDDKIKVIDTKTNFLKDELKELTLRYNLPNRNNANGNGNGNGDANGNGNANANGNGNGNGNETDPMATTDQEKVKQLIVQLANLENSIKGNVASAKVPSNNVLNMNLQSDKTDSTCIDIGTKMPEPTEKSFTDTFDITIMNSANTDQRPSIWCEKCNVNNNSSTNYSTSMCKAYNVCKVNYAKNNKVDNKSTFTTIGEIDKKIYDNCVNAFINFPKYLQANSDIAEIK